MTMRNHAHLLILTLLLAACAAQPQTTTPTAAAPIVTFATPPATEPAAEAATESASPATPVAEVAVVTDATVSNTQTLSATFAPAASSQQPAASVFTQLTTGGCCVQPFFSPDGAHVLYLDRPTPDAPVGIYGVPVNAPLSEPTLRTDRLGPFSPNMAYSADLINGQTFVESTAVSTAVSTTANSNGEGERFGIRNGGRSISFAPDNKTIAWTVGQESGNFDVRRNEIWIANLDGNNARRVATRYGGGIVAWFSDAQRMLISGKAARGDAAPTLSILDLRDGAPNDGIADLYSADRMRGFLMSPDDSAIIFFIAQAQDESLDGTYLLQLNDVVSGTTGATGTTSASGTSPQPQRLDFFGAYRWRDATHLLYIPLKLNLPSHELWQLDVTTGQSELLIPASAESQFKVGNGDWDVAPNGNAIAYLNARDRNIWLVALPPLP